jgi:hypothetical protein
MGWDCVCVELWPLMGPLSIQQMTHEWIWSSGGMILTGKPEHSERKLSQFHFVYHKLAWTDLGANPYLRGNKPASNRLSYGTANTGVYLCKSLCGVGICSFYVSDFPGCYCIYLPWIAVIFCNKSFQKKSELKEKSLAIAENRTQIVQPGTQLLCWLKYSGCSWYHTAAHQNEIVSILSAWSKIPNFVQISLAEQSQI